jgi:nephrocystin-3
MSPNQSTTSSRTIRVFLSSTFRDFAEERDLLVRKVFPELRRKCRERQVELVDVDLRWGITEKEAQQGKVLPICLAEVDRSRPWFMGFIGERYGWVPAPEQFDPAIVQEQPWLEEHRGGKSVTELEILHGVLNNPAMKNRAFFYFRDSKWSKKKGGAYLSEGSEEKTKLEVLKDRIRKSGFPVLENYPSPEALAERVKEDLWKLIDDAFPESEVPDALTRERMAHEAYAATRCRLYLGGDAYFKALEEAMKEKPFRPVFITGQSGGGKSALIANWLARWSRKHPKTAVIVHHLGSGSDAADPVRLVVRLMREISRLTGDEFKPESDPEKQLELLPQWLALASAWAQRSRKELLIVFDGLNKVSALKHLRWFPGFLPPKVKLVASCLHGEILEAAKGRLGWQELKVKPFTKVEQKSFIGEYLGRYRKALTSKQMKTLQSHALSGNPLFLLTVLEELRVFGVHEELEQRMITLLSPPPSKGQSEVPTVDDVFEHVLARIEMDLGKRAVQQAMEAIWASRAGLYQDELLAIAKLSPAKWAAMQNALDESLYESSGKISFGHDYLRKAVEDRYGLTGKRKLSLHRRLAEWFERREVDERVADELPWQWRQAEGKNKLVNCLLTQEAFEQGYSKDEYELLGYWLWTGADIEAAHKQAWETWLEALDEENAAKRASQLGGFLSAAGLYGTFTEELYRRALESREKVLGAEHPDTLGSVNNLGGLLHDKGDYEGAEALCRRALNGREKVLGSEHPDTLMSMNNLGSLISYQGDYKDAEVLYRRALEGKEKALGAEHFSTLSSAISLGNLLSDIGDYEGAEALCRRALEGYEKALGAEHPDTLRSVNSLAILLSDKGDYEGAEALCRRALEGYEKALGAEHPSTLVCVNNLGNRLKAKGDYEGAEALYRRALEGQEKALGREHLSTLMSVNNLGTLLRKKGDYKGAEALFRRALEGYEKALGVEHPDTLGSVHNLGNLLSDKGDYEGAEVLYRRALVGYENALGAEHPDTLISVYNLGVLLMEKGDLAAAELLYRRALEGQEKALGSEHPDTLTSAYTSAMILNRLGRLYEAVQLLRRFAGFSKNARDFVAYNLACYECLSGNTEVAKCLIKQHLKLHPEKKGQALTDEDFATIKDYIKSL